MTVNIKPPRTRLIAVAYGNHPSVETRTLGEDFYELRKFNRIQRAYMRALERTRLRVNSEEASRALGEIESAMPDVLHDASFAWLMDQASEAYAISDIRLYPHTIGGD